VRLLALSIAVSSAFLASQASALGLGELNVKSALNEPLQAEIQLLQVRDLKASEIRPRLADDDAFSLAGLSRSGVLNSVDFDVELDAQGGARVVIRSDTPVREPFISFLMEVNWPNGRLVREYTLLLDPPLYVESAAESRSLAAPAISVTTSEQIEAVKAEPSRVLTANPTQTVQTTLRTEASPTNQVYVGVNDTLYTLAQNNLPDETVSVNQMMLAIQRLNPDSFPTNNINVLKAGTVITLPNKAQSNALTARQATIEVRKQYDDWKSARPSSTPAPIETSEVSESVRSESEPSASQPYETDDSSQAKLKLVSLDEPKDQSPSTNSSENGNSQPLKEVVKSTEPQPNSNPSGSDVEPEKVGASAQSVQQPVLESVEVTPREQALQALNRDLENQLLVTQESVEKVERDNADLSAKLDSIVEQLQTMQRLIELKDQQVAQLQQQLDQQMTSAQQRNEDPIAATIDYVRMHPEIVGGSAVAFLLLLLLLVRSSKKPVPYREPEASQERVNEAASESVSLPVSPTMVVSEPAPVDTAFETSIAPVTDEKLEADSDSIAKAEAEIQSMIDEVLRARAIEEASVEPQYEVVSDKGLEPEKDIHSKADDFLSRANAAMSPAEVDVQEVAVNEISERQSDSDDLEAFFDSKREVYSVESGSVESTVEPVEEASAELQDLDFVIEPFDSDVVDGPQESQIPEVDIPLADSTVEADTVDSIEKDLLDLEALMDDVNGSGNSFDNDFEQKLESEEPLEENWEFVVEENDPGALDSEIEKIFDEVDGDLEVVEEINDTAESEDFDTHFYSGADENETRLDLARAYIEMDDYEAARDILVSMKDIGTSAQQQEVSNLLDQLDKA